MRCDAVWALHSELFTNLATKHLGFDLADDFTDFPPPKGESPEFAKYVLLKREMSSEPYWRHRLPSALGIPARNPAARADGYRLRSLSSATF